MEQIADLSETLQRERATDVRRLLLATDFTMISCRFWRNAAPWSVARRRVFDTMFLLPTKGRLVVILDDATREIGPGEALVLADGVTHELTIAKSCRRLEQFSLHCHLVNSWRVPVVSYLASPFVTLPHADVWHDGMARLSACLQHDEAAGAVYGEQLVRHLLSSVVLNGAGLRRAEREIDPRVAGALHAIHESHGRGLTVAALARQCELSEVQFRKLFARDVRARPQAYLAQVRLRAAARLLETSSMSVKRIAHECGFNSDHYFHLCFRRAYGCTPSGHRRARRHSPGV